LSSHSRSSQRPSRSCLLHRWSTPNARSRASRSRACTSFSRQRGDQGAPRQRALAAVVRTCVVAAYDARAGAQRTESWQFPRRRHRHRGRARIRKSGTPVSVPMPGSTPARQPRSAHPSRPGRRAGRWVASLATAIERRARSGEIALSAKGLTLTEPVLGRDLDRVATIAAVLAAQTFDDRRSTCTSARSIAVDESAIATLLRTRPRWSRRSKSPVEIGASPRTRPLS